MRFQDVVGQIRVKEGLTTAVNSGRLAHAHLFTGVPGAGQLPLAIAFAQYLMCPNRTQEDSCGECASCKKVASFAHPDLHFSFPFLRSAKIESTEPLQSQFREFLSETPYMKLNDWIRQLGNENKQGTITVQESQEIVKRLSLRAYEGGWKVMILWMAEKLHPSASNKLLKIIEEPPPGTIFILTTEDQGTILPTIRSRTQISSLAPLTDEEVTEGLKYWKGVPEDQGGRIAKLADGDFSEAIALAQDTSGSEEYLTPFADWMRICFQKDVTRSVEWVEDISRMGREWHKNFLAYGLGFFRQILLNNFVSPELVRTHEKETEFLENFRKFIGEEELYKVRELLEEAYYHVERNANPRILFLDLTLQLFQQIASKKKKAGSAA